MAEEVKKIITVEVGKSITSVRDFKKHIEDLRGALLGLNEESEEYKTIAEQIATDQAKLNDVMAIGKKNTDSAAGSYNDLNNQLKALRQQYKALSETERNSTTGQSILVNINKLDTQLKDIDASMGQYQRNVGNYKQAFESVFSSVASEVGKINPTLGNLLSAVQKLVPAFKGVGTAAKATGTSIKSAMASTGIGLLVIALGEIITHWEEIYSWVQKVLGKQEDLTKETGKTADELARAAEAARDYNFNLNLARGMTREESLQDQLDKDKKALDDLEYNVKRAETWMKRFRQENKYFLRGGDSIWPKKGDLEESNKKAKQLSETFGKLTIPLLKTEKEINEVKRLLDELGDDSNKDNNYRRSVITNRLSNIFEEALKSSEEEKKTLEKNVEDSKRALELEQTTLETAAKKRGQEARKALMTEKELRKQRYDDEVADAKKRITNETELKNTLEALEAEYLHDIQEMNERAWLSSDAYKKQEKDANDRLSILERLHEYNTSELDLLQEKYAKEKELIKGNGEAVATLTKEFMEKRHDIIVKTQFDTIDELKNAYTREIEVRKEYGLEYEDLEKELQDRITEFVLNKYRERIQKEREVLEQGLQDQNSWTNLQLQALNTTNTRADKSKLDPFGWFTGGGEEDIQKVYDLQDKIFDVEQQGYMERIEMYQEYLSKLATDSEEYYEIQKRLHEEEMELSQLEFERQEELADRALEKRKQTQQIILSLASSTASLYSSFTDIMLTEEDQGSNRWKAYKTSEAVVNTIAGALSAFMSGVNSGVPAPWNLILAGAMAASTAAAGYAEVRKIQATKMGSTNSTSGSPTANVSGVTVEPLLNPDYDLQRITNLSLQSDAYLPGNTQVYVLESDIQEVGNRVQVRENNATF